MFVQRKKKELLENKLNVQILNGYFINHAGKS